MEAGGNGEIGTENVEKVFENLVKLLFFIESPTCWTLKQSIESAIYIEMPQNLIIAFLAVLYNYFSTWRTTLSQIRM